MHSPQNLSVGGIEQMRLARLRAQAEAVADLRPQRRVDPRDGGAAGEIEMDQRVRAQGFDQLDVDGNAIGDIRGDCEMFGTMPSTALPA